MAGADLRAALVPSCFLGAFPPADLQAVWQIEQIKPCRKLAGMSRPLIGPAAGSTRLSTNESEDTSPHVFGSKLPYYREQTDGQLVPAGLAGWTTCTGLRRGLARPPWRPASEVRAAPPAEEGQCRGI